MKAQLSILLIASVLSTLLFGCASSTVIRSNVPGAKVYLNGSYVGNTPYVMSDTKIVGTTTSVRLEAPGYLTTHTSISRDESFSLGACIGGVFLLVPFLWIMEYQPEHLYELQPAAVQQRPVQPQPVQPQPVQL